VAVVLVARVEKRAADWSYAVKLTVALLPATMLLAGVDRSRKE